MSGKQAKRRRKLERQNNGGVTKKEWQQARSDSRVRLEQAAAARFDEAKAVAERVSPRLAKRMRRPTVGGLVVEAHSTNRKKRRNSKEE